MSKSEKGMVILYIKRTYTKQKSVSKSQANVHPKNTNVTPKQSLAQSHNSKQKLVPNHTFCNGTPKPCFTPPTNILPKHYDILFPTKKYKNHVHPMSTTKTQKCTYVHYRNTNCEIFVKSLKTMHIFCTFFVTVGG